MNMDQRSTEQHTRDYMSNRMRHETPPDLVDTIMGEVDRTPQRRAAIGWPVIAGGLAVATGLAVVAIWNAPPSGPVGGVPTPSPTVTAPASPSDAPSPTLTPSAETPQPTDEASLTPLPAPLPGVHAMTPEEAFDVPDDCSNPAAGYRIWMPDEWWYNTAFDDFDECQWFSPTTFEVTDSQTVPDEIAIVLSTTTGGDFGLPGEILSRQEHTVAGQPALRFEFTGGGGGFMPVGSRIVVWIVGIGGELPSENTTTPWLLATTGSDMGGDYETNVDVLDRMIATIQLIEP